jgi:uncharacterized protein YegL
MNIRIFLMLWACHASIFAQGSLELKVRVLTNKGVAMPNANIRLYEPSINETVNIVTDATGIAKTTLNTGQEWQVFINGMKADKLIRIPQSGMSMQTITETFDPEMQKRMAMQTYNRSNLKPIIQNNSARVPNKPGLTTVEVHVKSRHGFVQPGVNVYLLNTKDRTYYGAVTDNKGIARFVVPSSSSFDIDIESCLNIGMADLPNRDGIVFETKQEYDKLDIVESMNGDTVIQDLKGKTMAASCRAFYKLKIQKHGKPAAFETIYLKEINGVKVFKLKTDKLGEVATLLPFGKMYMINFDFQIDVDVIDLTRAYGQANGSMTLNYIPDPKLEHPELFIPDSNSLFLVDFENFLKKQYPKPQLPKKVNVVAKFLGKVNANSKEAVMEIGYTALGAEKNTPLNICFVIDVSGSMAGYYRLERLKTALASLVAKIQPDATISIVTFESSMHVVLEPQKLGNDKARVIKLINELNPGGGTNMLEALKTGYGFVSKNLIPKGNNTVILLTDGYDENEVQVLVDIQKPYNSKIVCTTIGVGEGYNYALLKQLASNGRGLLHFVGEADDFDKLFSTKLLSLLKPVATDVTLEIEYNKQIVFKHLFGPKPVTEKTKWPKYQLPNLYSGSNNVALAKFDIVKPDESIQNQPVIIRVSYIDEETGKKVVEEQKVYLEWEPYTGMPELIVEAEAKKLFCIAIINQGIKKMSDLYSAGNNMEAQKTLERTKEQVMELYPGAKEKEIDVLMASLDSYLVAFRNLAKKKAKGK